jgi:hypothetical protein
MTVTNQTHGRTVGPTQVGGSPRAVIGTKRLDAPGGPYLTHSALTGRGQRGQNLKTESAKHRIVGARDGRRYSVNRIWPNKR